MSIESLERLLGCKLERIHGEELPPVEICKNSPNLCGDVDIEWIELISEVEPDGTSD